MQRNFSTEIDKDPILTVADIGTGFKYGLVVFLTSWLFLTDSNSAYSIYDNTYRLDRALVHGASVFLVIVGFKALIGKGNAIQRQQLEDQVAFQREESLKRIKPQLRLDRSIVSEEVFFELKGVKRYEMRRTRAASIAMGTVNSKLGPVRVRAGQLAIDAPDVWRQTDKGVLVATDERLVFQGTVRRQEWKWHLVGDIVHDNNGLLIWPRNGKPIGMKLKPNPALFAFIQNQLEG